MKGTQVTELTPQFEHRLSTCFAFPSDCILCGTKDIDIIKGVNFLSWPKDKEYKLFVICTYCLPTTCPSQQDREEIVKRLKNV